MKTDTILYRDCSPGMYITTIVQPPIPYQLNLCTNVRSLSALLPRLFFQLPNFIPV